MQVSWTRLKELSTSKKVGFDHVEEDTRYIISISPINSSEFFCFIDKSLPRNSYQVDFEDNFLSESNKPVKMYVDDTVDISGLQSQLSIGTTPIEVQCGISRLSNRKLVTLMNTSNSTIYWGWTASVTISTGTPILKNQYIQWSVGPNLSIYVISNSSNNTVRITEAS